MASWHALDAGRFLSSPAVISTLRGELNVFGIGEDRAVWHNRFYSHWEGWRSLGGDARGELAVTSMGPGRVEVFYRRPDRAIDYGFLRDGSWTDWDALGSETYLAPFAVSHTEGTIDLFHYGTNGSLYRMQWR